MSADRDALVELAARWGAEAERYRGYVAGSSIPHQLAAVAKTLARNAADLRAELAAVKGRLCAHEIDRQRAKCAECESSKPERQEEVSA